MITPTAISTRAAGGISSAPPSSDDSYTASPSSSPRAATATTPVSGQATGSTIAGHDPIHPRQVHAEPDLAAPELGAAAVRDVLGDIGAGEQCQPAQHAGEHQGRRVRRPQLAIMLRWPTRWAAKALIRGGDAVLGTHRVRARRDGCIPSTVRASAGWTRGRASSAATAAWRVSPRNRDGGTRRPRRRE